MMPAATDLLSATLSRWIEQNGQAVIYRRSGHDDVEVLAVLQPAEISDETGALVVGIADVYIHEDELSKAGIDEPSEHDMIVTNGTEWELYPVALRAGVWRIRAERKIRVKR